MNAPHQKLNLEPTEELIRLLISLESSEAFVALMKLLEQRADGLAAWSCLIEHDTRLRWAQGRVQELAELLRAFHNRRNWKEVLDKKSSSGVE